MSQEVQLFNFERAQVRVVTLDGEPWFVAKDLSDALGYAWNGTARISHVPAEWRGVTSVVTPSGVQDMAVLSEQGMYFFLARSDKPAALPMQKWVAGEVLPSIRKTGSYGGAPRELSRLELLQMALEAEQQRVVLLAANQEQAAKIEALQNLFKEGMSPVQFCKGLNGVNVMRLGHYLESKGWFYNESKSGTRWRVASYARDRYLTEHQQQISPHGQDPFTAYTPILLRKGAVWLHERYLKGELPMKASWDGQFTHDKAERRVA